MSKQKESSGFGVALLIILGLGFVFQREKMNAAAENLGRFIGAIIVLGSQGQRQQQQQQQIDSGSTRDVPVPNQEGIVPDMLNAPNPYANSSFKWSPPPDISPQKTRCVTSYDSLGRVVTECQ